MLPNAKWLRQLRRHERHCSSECPTVHGSCCGFRQHTSVSVHLIEVRGGVSFVSVCCMGAGVRQAQVGSGGDGTSQPAGQRYCAAPARPKPGLSRQPASQPGPAANQAGPQPPGKAQPGTRKKREVAESQSHMTGKSLVAPLVISASSSFCVTFLSHRLSTWRARHPANMLGNRVLRRVRERTV